MQVERLRTIENRVPLGASSIVVICHTTVDPHGEPFFVCLAAESRGTSMLVIKEATGVAAASLKELPAVVEG